MVCTIAKNRSSAPGLTATTPAGRAGAVNAGNTIAALPVPRCASVAALVAASPKLRTAGSQVPNT